MEQIIYISTARQEPDAAMVQSILETSRRNNRRDGLTGLLAVGGRRFLQVLEGPPELCERTYERIRADPRHYALVQLSRRPIDKRAFGEWDMGYEQQNGEALRAAIDRLTNCVSDLYLKAQFRSFAELHSHAA